MVTSEARPETTVSQPPQTKRAPRRSYHRIRKFVHLACFLIFCALPFFDLMRFDIPRQRFYFLGRELWITEFGIIFFALIFLMFLIAVLSVFYGRVYCGYFCPQMIFSEASMALENRLRRWFLRRSNGRSRRTLPARAVFYAVLAVCSVFLAFVFTSYFVPPADLFRRLLSLDIRTAGGLTGAVVTTITFLDFALVRQRFCTAICPYGYLQGMLADGNTLLVHYRDENRECIGCKKCIRVCPTGIDIRTSPYQIECIHCGECIDACDEIMGRLGRRGLVHYAWGERGELLGGRNAAWYRRLGIRDGKRVAIILVLCFCAAGLYAALSLRRNVLVRLSPDRTTLYRIDGRGNVCNAFRYTLANRGRTAATVLFSIADLPGAGLTLEGSSAQLAPGQVIQGRFEVSAPRPVPARQVNHFRIVAHISPDGHTEVFPMTFLMPSEKEFP